MRKLTDVAVVTPFVKDLVAALLLQLLSTADALRRATLAIKALIQLDYDQADPTTSKVEDPAARYTDFHSFATTQRLDVQQKQVENVTTLFAIEVYVEGRVT